MSNLNKTASICATIVKQKMATNYAALDDAMRMGDETRIAIKDLAKSRQALAGGTPDWLKVLLGIGGGSVALNSLQNNDRDWRR